jgi:pyruvate dehydrogenase E2 component (dihydrolipoamide acetyltransferase)
VNRDIPLTRIQKLIAARMQASKSSKPCFYLRIKADVTELVGMRPGLRKHLGVKITTNAFYIKALALGAVKFPLIVGRLEGSYVRIAENINVGFAVMAPQGLVVPVVKNADKMSLAEIAQAEKELTYKARDNELSLEELENETIALSNLGAYDIDTFIGIVPPPASTILAVGNILREVIPIDGEAANRKMVSLTLAVDHCVINGAYAAQFLKFIKDELENPHRMVEPNRERAYGQGSAKENVGGRVEEGVAKGV